jgi:hypothetical protein
MLRLASAFVLLLALTIAAPASAQSLTRTQRIVRATGKAIGLGAGVAVTTALALSKKWNAPMRDPQGHIEKLEVRGYDFTLRERHRPVLGPKILAYAAKMKQDTQLQRIRYNFVEGLGQGAKIAPPIEGQMEAKVAATLHGH